MLKKSLYPKTRRLNNGMNWRITEKIDGSNLSFFKLDGQLFIAQRNNIYLLSDIDDEQQKMYKGLYGWLKEHGENLEDALLETSCIIGEWVGMGRIKYGDTLPAKFLMFAKANVNEDLELYNILYKDELFIYPFVGQDMPEFIGKVPVLDRMATRASIEDLDELYPRYVADQSRDVEGFIVTDGQVVYKYVRMKNGKLGPHKE